MTVNHARLADAASARSVDYSPTGERLALLSGVAFVVLLFVTIFTAPEPPSAWDREARLVEWLSSHRDIFLVNAYLRAVASFLMFIFITGVTCVVRRREGRTGMMSLLALGGALLFTLVMFVSQMADTAGALLSASGGSNEEVRAMAALGDTMRHFNALSGALMIGAVSIALMRARLVPRVVGWFGLLTAAVFVAGAAGFPGTRLEFVNSGIALPLLPLWPVVLSVTLLLRQGKNSEPPV